MKVPPGEWGGYFIRLYCGVDCGRFAPFCIGYADGRKAAAAHMRADGGDREGPNPGTGWGREIRMISSAAQAADLSTTTAELQLTG